MLNFQSDKLTAGESTEAKHEGQKAKICSKSTLLPVVGSRQRWGGKSRKGRLFFFLLFLPACCCAKRDPVKCWLLRVPGCLEQAVECTQMTQS